MCVTCFHETRLWPMFEIMSCRKQPKTSLCHYQRNFPLNISLVTV